MKFIDRKAFAQLHRLLSTFPAVLVYGPRQCGKRTLVRAALQAWAHVDLEQPRQAALLAASLIALAGCCNLDLDRLQRRAHPDETPTTKPTSTTMPTAPTAPTSRSTAEPSAKSGGAIECGSSACRTGAEICCSYYGKNLHVCKAAPANPIGEALLNACGARSGLSAMACDDSGDCEGSKICVMPVRWGTDVTYSTQECLAPNDNYAAEVERCGKGGVCKRKGMKCGSQGFCKM